MSDNKQVASNRKAFHDYEIMERIEAGISLTGTEIKSIRANGASIREAYARPLNGEMWLYGAHIAPYDAGSHMNHEPTRPRRLLLHRGGEGAEGAGPRRAATRHGPCRTHSHHHRDGAFRAIRDIATYISNPFHLPSRVPRDPPALWSNPRPLDRRRA